MRPGGGILSLQGLSVSTSDGRRTRSQVGVWGGPGALVLQAPMQLAVLKVVSCMPLVPPSAAYVYLSLWLLQEEQRRISNRESCRDEWVNLMKEAAAQVGGGCVR